MLLRRQWKWQRFRQSCETASPARDPSCARAWRSWRGPFSGAKKRPERPKLDDVVVVNREGSSKLIDLTRNLASIPVCSGDTSGFDDGSGRQGEPCRMDCRERQRGRQHWRRSIFGRATLVSGDRPMCDLCRAEGNRIDSKFRSFESFRSNLKSPEVLTLDELVEQARNFPTPSSKRLPFTVPNRLRPCNRRRNPV